MRAHETEILHVIGSFVAAGAERFVGELATALSEKGHSVGVAALSGRTDDVGRAMRSNLTDAGIFNAAAPTGPVRLRNTLWYARLLFFTRPRLIHLHTPNTDLAHYLARFVYRKRHGLFRTLHNISIPESKWYWHAIEHNPVSVSVACSMAVRDAMMSRVPGPIEVIQNGVSFNWPIRTEIARRKYAEKLKLSPDKRHFLAVGRMSGTTLESSAKGHDTLIRAWREIGMGESGGLLHLLGDGELRPQLGNLANGDPSILFHGVQSGIDDWLIGCDHFVMPSRREGLPIAGIEALGTGLPCIFSTIKPLRELGGDSAKWVEAGDVAGLARAMFDAVSAPREYPEELASRVRGDYSMANVARSYLECYQAYGYCVKECGPTR